MRFVLYLPILLMLSGCLFPADPAPTVTPTRGLSAPALALSPSPVIRSSDELYPEDEGIFVGQTNPTQAALPVDSEAVPIPHVGEENIIDIVLEDGTTLQGELFQSDTIRQAGILIVGIDRASWGTLPLELQRAGFTVLVMETGLIPQASSVETMLKTFINLGTVDPARIGVIGEAQGADIAMLACAFDELCDVVALLSPLSRDTLLNTIPSYGTRPLLLATSNQDSESYPATLALSQTAQGETRFIETGAGRGSSLLQFQPELISELVIWFTTYLNP